ncbi:sulfate adenylyltransferase [Ferroglobus placidus DSM 10642]|uniref:Sulfate adenylyltransferase n=1 Tax=Ferroglobus placidus (strain DSM 10642 / AEDII12DO) TaxID=589924 RepID=D3S249_FERPA|nr:sulfate adenylyltransferase [Ferroglobus placidus]ADC66540.1 sulfate adenylyltransferase [Ferroglobus placidus DSM 10642]
MPAKPHGGKLVNRVVAEDRRSKLLEEAKELPKIEISKETAVEVENIAHGVYSPLEGFMTRNDFISVLETMRLENDLPWTIPIVLDVSLDELEKLEIREGDVVALVTNGDVEALMEVEEIYEFDKREYAEKVFKTTDLDHPGVKKVFEMRDRLVGGKIELLNRIENPFEKYTLQPIETRVLFKELGWRTIVGFQTRNAPHLGHEYVQKTALTFVDGLFINPVIGKKKKGDFRDEVILKAYEVLIEKYYLKNRAVLAILRTEMRYAGPREAIFHAIVRKNFGCTHFIVGRDHAGVGSYYKPYEAQEIFEEFPDLGITPIFFKQFYYCKKCYGYVNEAVCPHRGDDIIPPSGTKIREMLMEGKFPPREMMRPEVAEVILSFEKPFVD